MKYLVIISTLFVIGSLLGWVIELFFRRFVSQKKWMNPGFLTGPYLPIYGFGVMVLYGVSNIPLGIEIKAVDIILHILIIGVGMTLIEFIAGLIFIKGFKVKLWDYSDRKGNIMGIICPSFSLIWLVVGSLYYFFLNPLLVQGISWISENLIYTYFVGAVIGAICVDFAYSIHLATKLKEFKELQDLRFEEFKVEFKKKVNELKNRIN
ncbi:MAG: putative ABC transporter permease [Bacilli bacterium]|nr:putative ABC transporter permease [Bacilli bacterium]MBO4682790.1 putative ABC transporter permease [Bacilli bacterium]